MGELQLTGEVAARGPAAAFVLADEQVAQLGENLLGLSRAVREPAGLTIGETVSFTIARDDAPREVELPEDFAAAPAGDSGAKAAFDALAFTHRKEFARWVSEAKRPETREKRIAETLVMVREGRTRS